MSSVAHPSVAEWLDYYLAEVKGEAADALEEHLFECSECEAQLARLRRTAVAMVEVVRTGQIFSGGTTALANRLARDRLNVRTYVLEPGDVIACTVGRDDDFLLGRFVLPAGAFERVDLRVTDASGQELMRVPDMAVDARTRHALLLMPARPVQREESGVSHYVLSTPDGDGEREIARYVLDHTAFREP